MYTGEQMQEVVTNILANLGDQGAVSNILNDLRTDYTETLTNYVTLTTTNEGLLKNNESLKNVNNKIMLQMGDVSAIVAKDKVIDDKKEEELQDDKDYGTLFNKEGELI